MHAVDRGANAQKQKKNEQETPNFGRYDATRDLYHSRKRSVIIVKKEEIITSKNNKQEVKIGPTNRRDSNSPDCYQTLSNTIHSTVDDADQAKAMDYYSMPLGSKYSNSGFQNQSAFQKQVSQERNDQLRPQSSPNPFALAEGTDDYCWDNMIFEPDVNRLSSTDANYSVRPSLNDNHHDHHANLR